MTDKTKKIIAREGLNIVGIYIVAILIGLKRYRSGSPITDIDGFVIYPILLYIAFLIIRFIIWAIRTLKSK